MNCMNCGAFLTDMDLDYCPNCGYNVLIQKKVDYLSKIFYNQGLEKASIRDQMCIRDRQRPHTAVLCFHEASVSLLSEVSAEIFYRNIPC